MNTRCEWGPGPDLSDAGLLPVSHLKGVVLVEKGETELSFDVQKDVEILAKLHNDNKSTADMARYVLHRVENNKVFAAEMVQSLRNLTFKI